MHLHTVFAHPLNFRSLRLGLRPALIATFLFFIARDHLIDTTLCLLQGTPPLPLPTIRHELQTHLRWQVRGPEEEWERAWPGHVLLCGWRQVRGPMEEGHLGWSGHVLSLERKQVL